MDAVDVIETTLGTEPRAKSGLAWGGVERLLDAIFPMANPDFDRCYARVRKWWIEINPAGEPQRELGLDEQGEVIVAGPIGENFGFFTDSNAVFALDEHPAVEQALFEAAWSAFEGRWAERQKSGAQV